MTPVEPASRLPYAATLLAIALALGGQQLAARNHADLWGWALLLVSAWLMAAAAASPLLGDAVPATWPAVPSSSPRRALAALATLLAAYGASALAVADRWPVVAVALWATSLAAASWGVRGWRVAPGGGTSPPSTRHERLAVCAILALAAVARFTWIGSLPYYYFADEARVAMFLLDAYRHHVPNFFTMGWNTWPVVGLSWQGMLAPLLGMDIAALRLSSALSGTVGVLATYLLARELYTPRIAVLAAVVMAMSRTAIDFSRLGTCHAQVLLLEPLAFFVWWRAVRVGTALSYLWAGIAIGLCFYTYNAGQSVFLVWLGWLVLCAVVARRSVATHWRGVAITVVGCVLTVLPYAWHVTDNFHFGDHWEEWTVMARDRQVLGRVIDVWGLRGVWAAVNTAWFQVARTWMGFHLLPAGAYELGYRGGGMLDNISGPLFILGLAACLARLFQVSNAFLVYWWLLTTVTGGVLTRDPPAFVRLVGLLPALAIMAALPLDGLLGAPRRWRTLSLAVATLLLCWVGWENWRTYFVKFPRDPVDLTSDLARRLEDLPRTSRVYLLGSEYAWRAHGWQINQFYFGQELFAVNFRDQDLRDVAEPAHLLPLREAGDAPLVVVLGPTQLSLVDRARALYPHTRVTDVVRSEGLTYRILEIAPEDIAARSGLMQVEYDAVSSTAPALADPFVSLTAHAGTERWRVWRGQVYWPTDQPVTLELHTAAPADVRIAGRSVMHLDDPRDVAVPLQLPRGWQPLVIDERTDTPHALTMEIYGKDKINVTRSHLRPEREPEGLTAVYRRNGAPIMRTIDPQLNSFADERLYRPPSAPPGGMPFSVTWRGALRITQAGEYEFEAHSTGPLSAQLDGAALLEAPRPASPEPIVARARRRLEPGDHTLIVRWDCTQCTNQWRRLLQLYWKPPGGERQLIPPPHFVPHTDDAEPPNS